MLAYRYRCAIHLKASIYSEAFWKVTGAGGSGYSSTVILTAIIIIIIVALYVDYYLGRDRVTKGMIPRIGRMKGS